MITTKHNILTSFSCLTCVILLCYIIGRISCEDDLSKVMMSGSENVTINRKVFRNNQLDLSPTTCPSMIYSKDWRQYLLSPESKNHFSTSELDRVVNYYLPLYNQTEW